MRFYAMPIVDGWVELEVEASSEEEARKKMSELLCNMDFGELRDVSWDESGFEIESDIDPSDF